MQTSFFVLKGFWINNMTPERFFFMGTRFFLRVIYVDPSIYYVTYMTCGSLYESFQELLLLQQAGAPQVILIPPFPPIKNCRRNGISLLIGYVMIFSF